MNVEIPRGDVDTPGPCWLKFTSSTDGTPLKPRIKCKCGKICNISLHHVHADGTVTASFYHAEFREWTEGGKKYTHEPGCGWHVHLKLKDYDGGDFPPTP